MAAKADLDRLLRDAIRRLFCFAEGKLSGARALPDKFCYDEILFRKIRAEA